MSVQANVRIGDCDLYLDKGDGQGEIPLGSTKGGVEFTFEREFTELTVDKFGSMPLDLALTGQNLLIHVYLAEPILRNLDFAMPEGLYARRPSTGQTITDQKVGLGTDSGYTLFSDAGLLRLHPRNLPGTNVDEDIYIWKAVSAENIELPFKIDEQRILEITFRALVDETQQNGMRLGRIGNDAIS